MDKEPLTSKQRSVYDEVTRRLTPEGQAPPFRELMGSLGFRNPNAVAAHMKALVRKGYLVKRGRSYFLATGQLTIGPDEQKSFQLWLDSLLDHFMEALRRSGHSSHVASSTAEVYRSRLRQILPLVTPPGKSSDKMGGVTTPTP